MAARRLVLVMLVLLFISTLLAALVPVEQPPSEETRAERAKKAPEPTGERISRTIDAAAKRPALIPMTAGDQLSLTVRSPRADQVEIPALGELEDVDPEAAARFDLLPAQPGTYAVRLLGSGRVIARIEVSERERDPGAPADRSRPKRPKRR